MKNKLKVLLLLPILSLVLTGCTVKDIPLAGGLLSRLFKSSATPTTIKFWGLWEDPKVFENLALKYKETHPNIVISYEDRSIMNLEDYRKRIQSDSNLGSEIDIIMVHNTWVPGLTSALATAPDSVFNVTDYSKIYYPIIVRSAVVNQNIYAAPAFYEGLMLVYNKAHFKEVGQLFPPTAWEEFRRLAIELTIKGGEKGDKIIRGGAAIGTATNVNHSTDILGLMWAQAGVPIPAEMDSDAAADVLEFYTNFAKVDKVWDATMPEAATAFASGKVSMIFVPSWQLLDIIKYFPNVADIGVAPVPQALPDTPAGWASLWMYAVPKGSKNKTEAWNFIKFLTDDETQRFYYSEQTKLRFFGSAFASQTLFKDVTSYYLKPLIQDAPNAKSGIFTARSGNTTNELKITGAVAEVLQGITPKAALTKVKTEITY